MARYVSTDDISMIIYSHQDVPLVVSSASTLGLLLAGKYGEHDIDDQHLFDDFDRGAACQNMLAPRKHSLKHYDSYIKVAVFRLIQ